MLKMRGNVKVLSRCLRAVLMCDLFKFIKRLYRKPFVSCNLQYISAKALISHGNLCKYLKERTVK
jgi:hypothetical protein